MDRCPTCHAPVEVDDYWCERCATRLDFSPEPEPEPVAVPPPPPPPPPPPKPRPRRRPGPPPIPVVRAPWGQPTASPQTTRTAWIVRIAGGVIFAVIFISSVLTSDPEPQPDPLEPYMREQTVVARSGVYSTKMVIDSIEHQNDSVDVTPTLIAPGNVSTLYGPGGTFRITEVEFPAGEVPPLEATGAARCADRGSAAVVSPVRGIPTSTCHWNDGVIHDELMVVHANRVLLFEYVSTSDDNSPFTHMVESTRLYPPKKAAE